MSETDNPFGGHWRNLSPAPIPPKPDLCDKCGRPANLYLKGVQWWCGSCLHREERRINTKEMYGKGRRGY